MLKLRELAPGPYASRDGSEVVLITEVEYLRPDLIEIKYKWLAGSRTYRHEIRTVTGSPGKNWRLDSFPYTIEEFP